MANPVIAGRGSSLTCAQETACGLCLSAAHDACLGWWVGGRKMCADTAWDD